MDPRFRVTGLHPAVRGKGLGTWDADDPLFCLFGPGVKKELCGKGSSRDCVRGVG